MKSNLNEFEAAAYLTEHGVPTTVGQLRAWRKMPWDPMPCGKKYGPEFYDLPGRLFYPVFELDYYIEKKGVKN